MKDNRHEIMSLYNEMVSIDDQDIEFAIKRKSMDGFKNDVELYIFVCDCLISDLILLEEYELCVEVSNLKEKLTSAIDRIG